MKEFDRGVLISVGLIAYLHDQPMMAAEVLREMGLLNADCSELDDYDKRNLKLLKGERAVKLRGLKSK